MGQRTRILTEILGVRGWKIVEADFETERGERFEHLADVAILSNVVLVLRVERRWAARCSACGAICRGGSHEHLERRRWRDLPWAGRSVFIEAEPEPVNENETPAGRIYCSASWCAGAGATAPT